MDREGFKNRMKQYKKAREENPGLKYWEWKDIPKYDEGTGSVGMTSTTSADGRTKYVYYDPTMDLEYQNINLPEVTITGNKNAGKRLPIQVPEGSYERFKTLGEIGKTVGSFLPVAGEMIDTYDLATDIKNKDWTNTATRVGSYFVPNIIEKGGELLYKSIRNLIVANRLKRASDKVLTMALTQPPPLKSISFEPTVDNMPYVDYQLADMRNFLKTRFNKWTNHYGYDPVPLNLSLNESLLQMKDRIIQHNTFVRGVRDPKQEMDYYLAYDPINPRVETMSNAYNSVVQELDRLGLDNTAENRMRIAASLLVGKTGHGRAGFPRTSDVGALYTSNSLNTAGGYASYGEDTAGKVFKVQRPVDFSGDYHDWLLNGDFPLYTDYRTNRVDDDKYFFQELPYLLQTGRSLKTDALKRISDPNVTYETLLKDYTNLIKFHHRLYNITDDYSRLVQAVDKQFEDFSGYNKFYKRNIDPNNIIEAAARFDAIRSIHGFALPNPIKDPHIAKLRYKMMTDMYFKTYHSTINNLKMMSSPRKLYSQYYNKLMASPDYYNAIMDIFNEANVRHNRYDRPTSYNGIFTTEPKHKAKKGNNAYLHFIFTGNPGGYPVKVIEEIPLSVWKEHNSKTRAHVGKSFEGLSRKSYAEGGQVEPNSLNYFKYGFKEFN